MGGIFIYGNVPSSKNSKVWTGRALVWSKTAQEYVKNSEWLWNQGRLEFLKMIKGLEKPYRISFKFIRGSRHKFDYPNPLQTVLDLMVRFQWLDDDNADEIIPSFDLYEYDKENPGVVISLTKK